jgi:hypothetical protein
VSSKLKGWGNSWPKGHVALQLLARQLAALASVQLRQVEVELTGVMDAKLVVNVIGGKSGPVLSCCARAEDNHTSSSTSI